MSYCRALEGESVVVIADDTCDPDPGGAAFQVPEGWELHETHALVGCGFDPTMYVLRRLR